MACLLDLDGTEDPDFEYTAVREAKWLLNYPSASTHYGANYAIIRVRFSDN